MSADRPLTEAQELALIRAGEAHDRDAREPDRRWGSYVTVRYPTGAVLERLGLVNLSLPYYAGAWRMKITEAGLAMLRSMGD